LVIDISGELLARRGERFEDYTDAIENLGSDPRFPTELVRSLKPLPGLRNVRVHEYVLLDMQCVVEALDQLGPVADFFQIVRKIEAEA
jgi:uncharacterized protein YutE (UPF0331/DUF86 family)